MDSTKVIDLLEYILTYNFTNTKSNHKKKEKENDLTKGRVN